jgi:hypothetical protein
MHAYQHIYGRRQFELQIISPTEALIKPYIISHPTNALQVRNPTSLISEFLVQFPIEPKSKPLILVRYDEQSKAYRSLDYARGKIIISRDVIFDEIHANLSLHVLEPLENDELFQEFVDQNSLYQPDDPPESFIHSSIQQTTLVSPRQIT